MGLLDDLEFLKKRKPNLLADVRQLQGPSEPYLRQQYPEVYGGLGGLLGMAPDEMAGSVLDPNTARVRSGAQIGFPVGTAAQIAPLAPMLAPAVKAGVRALGPTAVRMGEGYLQSKGLMPQLDVYHGSPHKFDRFDASKIGTGEGNQAYGHGLYTAEAPAVAKEYQLAEATYKTLHGGLTNKQEFVADMLSQGRPEMSILDLYAQKYGGSFDDAMKDLIDVKEIYKKSGNFYKVDLPDEQIAKMLDWDKPLSEQSAEVQKVFGVTANGKVKLPNGEVADASRLRGESAYRAFAESMSGDVSAASAKLRELGIPGIKYLDATSRGAGTGTRNFVTFPGEEQSLTILERNGQPMIARTQQQDATPDLLQYQQMLDDEERRKSAGLLFR